MLSPGSRGLARAKLEYADALEKLRRSLRADAGKEFLSPDVATDVRRYFGTAGLTPEQETGLREAIVGAFSREGAPSELESDSLHVELLRRRKHS